MKIGVDLRVLQIGHQYRGIGEVTKQCLNRLLVLAQDDTESVSFVFFVYTIDKDGENPLDLIHIPKGMDYEVVDVGMQPLLKPNRSMSEKLTYKYRLWLGNPLPQAKRRCNVLLQFDYALGVTRHPKTVLIAHDLIPYIFWKDYFTSPWVDVKHRAARTTLRTMTHNYEFKRVLKRSHRSASRILCVSDSTRNDLRKYLHISAKKMEVIHLGVSEKLASTSSSLPRSKNFPTKPFLLFVGGIDKRRRRIDDLIAAYNNLKAAGHDIQLALVGENFQGPDKIPDEVVRKAVIESSYSQDILTLGYIDDKTKQALYKKAVAFVFPTIYEGFGIPVLEAMLLECPVITYKNSSIPEVGGVYVHYAKDWQGIWRQAEQLLAASDITRQKQVKAAREYAQKFTWDATASKLYKALSR